MKNKKLFTKISVWVQSLLYMGAGINHFVNPGSYIAMVPPYIPFRPEVNIAAGVMELLLGLLLITWAKQRKVIAMAIITLLILFIPAHIYHIQMLGNIPGCNLVLPLWGTWVRLFMQLVLIAWAWSIRKV